MCILYTFGCSPQIYCTYLMFGWYFHVYLQCQRHILLKSKLISWLLFILKVQDQKDWQTECFLSKYKNISTTSCFEFLSNLRMAEETKCIVPIFDVALQHRTQREIRGLYFRMISMLPRNYLTTTSPLLRWWSSPCKLLVSPCLVSRCRMYIFFFHISTVNTWYIHLHLVTLETVKNPPSQNLKRGFVDAVKDMSCLVYNPRSSLGTAEICP